jgi:hypothetical protein
MVDEHRPELPADADPLEAALFGAWRDEAAGADEGPSELVDARILRAAREALAEPAQTAPKPSLATSPAWLRWSAAASMAMAVGLGLLLWSAEVTQLDVPLTDAPELGRVVLQAPVMADDDVLLEEAMLADRPARTEADIERSTRSMAERARPAAAAGPPPVAMEAMPAFAASPPLLAREVELTGTIRRIGDEWWFEDGDFAVMLDLERVPDATRTELRPDAPVTIRFVGMDVRIRVLGVDAESGETVTPP